MSNVVLIGFMGCGKSSVGVLLAQHLGRPFKDLDDEITGAAGRSVSAIFDAEGESGFRRREADCLHRVLATDGQVVAVGGGAPLDDDNWRRIRDGNCVVALTAEPAELASRLNGATSRPLLKPDTPTAIATLLPGRVHRYLEADLVVATDHRSVGSVAEQLAGRLPAEGVERVPVKVPGAAHEIVIGHRLAHLAGPALRRSGAGDTVVLVTDPNVGKAHADQVLEALREAGFAPALFSVPVGEAAKHMDELARLYEYLAALRLDRDGALIALGGGAVGDLTGFAAATWLRGVRYVHIPTTLLAMVDSSIGGKTAINLPSGKNLVGAVHQPAAIVCDLEYLGTLPEAEFRSGMAEVCKAAIIAEPALADWLLASAPRLQSRDRAAIRAAVRRAAAVKAAVVSEDPNETGRRAILNYGHTIGHALERALGYGTIRHGEAVAWGMEVAARLSLITGRCGPDLIEQQRALLRASGLLATRPKVSRHDLLDAMEHDKKARNGVVRWVLLRGPGDAEWGCQVGAHHVTAALDRVFEA
ncbi:MAG: 3-dehydroquinate synthase [Candidatus Dormibacter sp.]